MMQLEPTLLTAAIFAPFMLEALKWLYRRLVAKDPNFDFPKIFYTLAIPFSTLIAQITLGFVGWAVAPEVSASYVLQWFIGIVITLAVYQMTIKPLKGYDPNNY